MGGGGVVKAITRTASAVKNTIKMFYNKRKVFVTDFVKVLSTLTDVAFRRDVGAVDDFPSFVVLLKSCFHTLTDVACRIRISRNADF